MTSENQRSAQLLTKHRQSETKGGSIVYQLIEPSTDIGTCESTELCHGTKCPTYKLSSGPIMTATFGLGQNIGSYQTEVGCHIRSHNAILCLPQDQIWLQHLVRDQILLPYDILYFLICMHFFILKLNMINNKWDSAII